MIPMAFLVISLTARVVHGKQAEKLLEVTVKCPKDPRLREQITRENANDNIRVRCSDEIMRK